MKKLLVILLATTLFSCDNEVETKEVIKPKILVLGNSITKCEPGGEWTSNWGMAASSPDKDFCGLLNQTFEVDRKNIAIWENNFNCDEIHYKFVTTTNYDYIIFKIGENVSDIQNFKSELKKITDFYKNYTNKIILVSTIWKQYEFDSSGVPHEVTSDKDRIIREVANENDFIFVDISDMKNNNSFYAWDEYQDSAIGSHPNDLGMEFIANKIIQEIQ
jgi:hypothetical protein